MSILTYVNLNHFQSLNVLPFEFYAPVPPFWKFVNACGKKILGGTLFPHFNHRPQGTKLLESFYTKVPFQVWKMSRTLNAFHGTEGSAISESGPKLCSFHKSQRRDWTFNFYITVPCGLNGLPHLSNSFLRGLQHLSYIKITFRENIAKKVSYS